MCRTSQSTITTTVDRDVVSDHTEAEVVVVVVVISYGFTTIRVTFHPSAVNKWAFV